MEPVVLKAGSTQEDGFGVQPRRVADLGRVPSLQRSSSLCRSRRPQYAFSSCEEVGFQGPGPRVLWGPVTMAGEGGCPAGQIPLPWGLQPRKPRRRENRREEQVPLCPPIPPPSGCTITSCSWSDWEAPGKRCCPGTRQVVTLTSESSDFPSLSDWEAPSTTHVLGSSRKAWDKTVSLSLSAG